MIRKAFQVENAQPSLPPSGAPGAIRSSEVRVRAAGVEEEQVIEKDLLRLVVHDLKGPLSAMAMNVEFAIDGLGASNIEAVRAALLDCRLAGARLFRMVTNLLDIARDETEPLRPSLSRVSVGSILESMALEHAEELALRRVVVSTRVPESLETWTDPDLLERLTAALFEILLRRTRPGGCVILAANEANEAGERPSGSWTLRVGSTDRIPLSLPGPRALAGRESRRGMSQDDLHRVLDLVFCRRAAAALGGTLDVVADPLGVSSFLLWLPDVPSLASYPP